jgi:hypothetical protein
LPVADLLSKAGKEVAAIEILRKIGITAGHLYDQLLRQQVERKLSAPGDLSQLSDDEKRIAAKILIGEEKFLEAAGQLQSIGDTKGLLEIASETFRKDRQLFVSILKILISTYIFKKEFRMALSFVDGSGNNSLKATPFYHQLKALNDQLSIYITKDLAASPLLHLSDQVELVRISEFLKTNFLENRLSDWPKRIHPLIVGAAMERAGKDIDCLKFYGALETSSKESPETRENAKKRLAATKLRRSKREEREGRTDQSARSYNEAVSKANEIGVDLADLPQFPVVVKYLSEPVKLNEKSQESVEAVKEGNTENEKRLVITDSLPPIRELKILDLFVRVNTLAKSIHVLSTKHFSKAEFYYIDDKLIDNDRVIKEESEDLLIMEWGVRVEGWKDVKRNGRISFHFINEGVDFNIKLF